MQMFAEGNFLFKLLKMKEERLPKNTFDRANPMRSRSFLFKSEQTAFRSAKIFCLEKPHGSKIIVS